MNRELIEYISHSSSWIEHEVSSIGSTIYEWEERDRWVKNITFLPNEQTTGPENILLDVEWTFEEVESDALVTFMYMEQGEWLEVEAEKRSGLTYRVTVQLDAAAEYAYQILAQGSVNKGSEISYIPTEIYKPIPLSIRYGTSSISGSSTVEYELYVDQYEVNYDFYEVVEIFALITKGNVESEKQKLQRRNTSWSVAFVGDEHTTVQLEVHYKGGYVETMDADIHYMED